MAGGKRRAGQELADFLADGGQLGRPLTYLEFVQFRLNEGRVRLRRAYTLALALSVTSGGGEVTRAWALALCEGPEEAEEVWFEWQKAIGDAKARARRGV